MKKPSQRTLRSKYLKGKSAGMLAEEYGVSKKTILNWLHDLPDWPEVKKQAHKVFLANKAKKRVVENVCEVCGITFPTSHKQRFCGEKCRKGEWQRNDRKLNRDERNAKRRANRAKKEKKLTNKKMWEQKFREKIAPFHPRSTPKYLAKVMKRGESTKNSLVTRSRKAEVECFVTVEDIRQMLYDAYGQPCKYCGRTMTVKNMQLDHIVPLSKGGDSTLENLQIICKTSNAMKGSLDEENFLMLLDWLKTIPEEMAKDIAIRLSRGIH